MSFVIWMALAHAAPDVLSSSADLDVLGAMGDRFGYQLASGDLNADGVLDVVVTAPHPTGGNRVYVYFGPLDLRSSATLDTSDAAVVIEGPSGSETGWSVAVGDVMGSDADDLIVGAPSELAGFGKVHLFRGPLSAGTLSTATDATHTISGLASGYLGWSVTAGDFNGNGKDELGIGACYAGVGGSGRAYLLDVNGPTPPVDTSTATTFLGVGLTGCSMANAGDFDGDGYEDLLIGSTGSATTTGYSYGGAVHLVYGRPSFNASYPLVGDPVDDITNLTAESEGANFGYSIAPAGDVNLDGNDDILIGAPAVQCDLCTRPEHTGRAYLVLGSHSRGTGTNRGLYGSSPGNLVADLIYEGARDSNTGISVDGVGFLGTTWSKFSSSVLAYSMYSFTLAIGTTDDLAYIQPYDDHYWFKLNPQYRCVWTPELNKADCSLDTTPVPPQRARRVDLTRGASGLTRFLGDRDSVFGYSVLGPGDLDGDGNDDLVFGATYQAVYDAPAGDGEVFLFRGR